MRVVYVGCPSPGHPVLAVLLCRRACQERAPDGFSRIHQPAIPPGSSTCRYGGVRHDSCHVLLYFAAVLCSSWHFQHNAAGYVQDSLSQPQEQPATLKHPACNLCA